MSFVQTAPGRLDAEIRAVSTKLVEVREASFQAPVILTTESAFPRFAIAMNLCGKSQLFGSPLTNSNVAYTNGRNGVFARVQGGSTWCNVSMDFELAEQVAATHNYLIPSGDASCGLPIDTQNALVSRISLAAREQCFTELTDAQLNDEITLLILRTLNPPQKRGGVKLSEHYSVVQRIIEYIHAHYFDRMTVTGLCQLAGVSERTLQYIFLASTGLTVQQYLMHYRLHRAHAMLAKGQVRQVKDAAKACGIPHTGRFSQYFKKMFGEPPNHVLLAR